MCGIFGIFEPRPSGVPDESKLHRTAALLRHRGPDGLGVFSEPGIGLVHTRLSLVDLSDRSNVVSGVDNCLWVTKLVGKNFELVKGATPICGATIQGATVSASS